MSLLARGMEVYELHECYNCHKIGGKGGAKKRGPELDNVGNLLTIDDIKKKIVDPTYLYAEGFEKEHKKGVMPGMIWPASNMATPVMTNLMIRPFMIPSGPPRLAAW